jgi:hypothetical protein
MISLFETVITVDRNAASLKNAALLSAPYIAQELDTAT